MRQSKSWSQEEMADKLGMSVNGYGKIEQGKTDTTFSKLEQIAEAFEIDLMELMSFGEKHLYLISGDNHSNNGCNVIGSAELAFEVQKLQLINAHQIETIAHLEQDIGRLTEMLALYKQVKS